MREPGSEEAPGQAFVERKWRAYGTVVNVCRRSGTDRHGKALRRDGDPWVAWIQHSRDRYEDGLASALTFASAKEARDAALIAVLMFEGTAAL
jgi:hypothetical protein